MIRLLHTSDWHLGLKLAFVPGEGGARAREQRFQTVEAIATLAHDRQVDAVLVAGDVLDDNAVGPDTLSRARDALTAFAPIPVLLLPGNHDAATAGSALERLAPQEHGLDHVQLLLEETPVEIASGAATVYPCPLKRRHLREDPTAQLLPRSPGDAVRVALAHGSTESYQEEDTANLIDFAGVLAKGFDYLALGDWHGTVQLGPRAAYSGAPEPTGFKRNAPGNVLLVEIEGAEAEPRTEIVPVARMAWEVRQESLDSDGDLDAFEAWLRALPEKSRTLLELSVEGSLSIPQRARLDLLLEDISGQLAYLRIRSDLVQLRPDPEDFESLELEGFVGKAVDLLREDESQEGRDALLLLHRLLDPEG